MRILLVLTFFSFFSNAQNSERDAYNFFLKGEYNDMDKWKAFLIFVTQSSNIGDIGNWCSYFPVNIY